MFDRRAVRTQCGKSLEWVGATSGTSGHTARLYEIDPLAVTERSRAKLAPVYEQLAKFLSETLAP